MKPEDAPLMDPVDALAVYRSCVDGAKPPEWIACAVCGGIFHLGHDELCHHMRHMGT